MTTTLFPAILMILTKSVAFAMLVDESVPVPPVPKSSTFDLHWIVRLFGLSFLRLCFGFDIIFGILVPGQLQHAALIVSLFAVRRLLMIGNVS